MNQTSLDKDKIRILLLENVHPSALETFNKRGYHSIESIGTALPADALQQAIADVHFIGIRSRTQLTQQILECAPKLIGIGCFCIGTNQVDLQAATDQGIVVFNAPFSNTRSVAELVIAGAILLLRDIPRKNAAAHRGQWHKSADNAYELRGKTLGIVGYGSIGSQLGIIAESLGMQVLFYDVINKLPLGNTRQMDQLDELLQQADIVSLHVPETAQTQWMIGAPQLAQMKATAILINASRGTVVDIDALSDALGRQQLLGAAIDVFPVEPRSNQEPFVSPLQTFDNVILTPHIGGSTQEAQYNIGIEVAEKMVQFSDTGTSLSAVNFPEVALPAHPGTHRLLHVHSNRPGVLSEINQIFSSNHINISGQYLQTKGSIGYVVIDVDQDCSQLALAKMREIPGTLKSRLLF